MVSEDAQWHVVPSVRVNCKDCLAECCKHIAIPIPAPKTLMDLQRISSWLHHEGVSVYKDEDAEWLVEVRARCGQLVGKRCAAWGTPQYPRICDEYDMHTCVMNETSAYWRVALDHQEQVVAFASKLGIRGTIRSAPPSCGDGGSCCRHLVIPIDAPTDWRDYDDLRWYLAHEGILAFQDRSKRWWLQCTAARKESCAPCASCHQVHGDAALILRTWEDIAARCIALGLVPPVPRGKAALKLTAI